jgi:HlyD family secretion protein
VYLVIVAGIILAFVYAFQPQPVPADFANVVRGPMQVSIDEEGETRIRERFVVSAPVAGRVLRINLEPGDRVIAGRTVIATFLPTDSQPLDARSRVEAEARVRAAETHVQRARANRDRVREELTFSQTQLKRYAALLEEGLTARERYDQAVAEVRSMEDLLKTAEFEVASAEQAVDVARAALIGPEEAAKAAGRRAISIRSPSSGVVLRKLRESESVVPSGEPLVEIGDTGRIEVVSDLLSADAVKVQQGFKVLIEQWGGGTTLYGRVRLVEPAGFTKLSALGVEEQRVNVIIDLDPGQNAAAQLGDGYRVEVRIVTWQAEDVVKVPTSALFRSGEDWAVYKEVSGKAALQKIRIGQRNGLEAEVLEGLAESDRVIVHPSDNVVEGVEIVPRV